MATDAPVLFASASSSAGARRRLLLFVVLATALVLLYRDSWFEMARIWWVSDTFAHGMFILPLSVWLVYRMRGELTNAPLATAWLALPLLALAGLAWALARVADVLVVQQFATVMMIPLLVLLLFGRRRTESIAFPLGFLLLAVPVGEGLTPYLIDWTADFVVFALRLTGFPVFREGNSFSIPSGHWSVVTGCSGLRYLMATITVALLYAYLSFRAYWRRAVFVLAGIAVAIIGNWLRAYGIVMIAHLSGMKLALGVDHFIYGWVFFGILIFALMWFGSLWIEPEVDPAKAGSADRSLPSREHPQAAVAAMLMGLCILALAPLLVHRAEQRAATFAADRIALETPTGWERTAVWNVAWRPEHHGETQLIDEQYRDGNHPVGVFIAYYPAQRQGAELINARNRLWYEKDPDWKHVAGTPGMVTWGDTAFPYRQARISTRDDRTHLLVWQSWWIGGQFTTSSYRAKLQEAMGALLGQGRRGAWIVLYTPIDEQRDQAEARLAAFAKSLGAAQTGTLGSAANAASPAPGG